MVFVANVTAFFFLIGIGNAVGMGCPKNLVRSLQDSREELHLLNRENFEVELEGTSRKRLGIALDLSSEDNFIATVQLLWYLQSKLSAV